MPGPFAHAGKASVQCGTHLPARQVWEQGTPHPPQFAGSDCVSTQAVPHRVCEGEHRHVLLMQ
jgi:hypothetical protein